MKTTNFSRCLIALLALATVTSRNLSAGESVAASQSKMMPIYFEEGDINDAYRTAIALNLPLVVIFTHRHADGTCEKVDAQIAEMRSHRFGIDSRQAVFYICCVKDERGGPIDEAGLEVFNNLELTDFPATIILAVGAKQAETTAVLKGKFGAEEMTAHFHKFLKMANATMAEWKRKDETMMSEAKQDQHQPGQSTSEG